MRSSADRAPWWTASDSQANGALPDWWVCAYAALCVLVGRALVLEARLDDAAAKTTPVAYSKVKAKGTTAKAEAPEAATVPAALRPALVGFAAMYAFGGPLLGVQVT